MSQAEMFVIVVVMDLPEIRELLSLSKGIKAFYDYTEKQLAKELIEHYAMVNSDVDEAVEELITMDHFDRVLRDLVENFHVSTAVDFNMLDSVSILSDRGTTAFKMRR